MSKATESTLATTDPLAEVNAISLRLFNAVVAQPNETAKDSKSAIRLLNEYHVAIVKEALYAQKQIVSFVQQTRRTVKQLNATFYRAWQDIISRTRSELLLDQILHYESTYGTGHTAMAYIPASAFDIDIEMPFAGLSVTVIEAIEPKDLKQKTWSLISGGTALSTETVKNCVTILDWLDAKVNIDEVRNREAVCMLLEREIDRGHSVTCNPDEFIRVLVYRATEELLLIKSAQLLQSIRQSERNDISGSLESYGVLRLAAVFNRYRAFFLAFKLANKANITVINHISKLSKTLHKPLWVNPLNTVTWRELDMPAEMNYLERATYPALLRALNACNLGLHEQHGFLYTIRNGSIWVADKTRSPEAMASAKANFDIILSHIKKSLGSRFVGKSVYIPKNIEYGLPISEKQMLGNIPYGTRMTWPSTRNVAVGIFWDESCRCQDLDLSGRSLDGQYISWNSEYEEGPFVYSGDMTSVTDDGATEYILCQGLTESELQNASKDSTSENKAEFVQLRVNCYQGNSSDHEFDIIIGTGDDVNKEYMMNPANLVTNFRFHSHERESTLGILQRTPELTTFILVPGNSGRSSVASTKDDNISTLASNAIIHKLHHSLSLADFLELLGATVVRAKTDDSIDFDLDLDKINRDFFNLLYENWELFE